MVNGDHYNLLVKGSKELDRFRAANPDVRLNLKAFRPSKPFDFSGMNLSGVNLRNASLPGSKFIGANLSGADLYEANLSNADLTDANLTRADLTGATLQNATIERANFESATLASATLADVSGKRAQFTSADLRPRDGGQKSTLCRADLSGAVFNGAKLHVADFTSAHLENCGFEKANCEGAFFKVAKLSGARFKEAIADRADFSHTASTGLILTDARLKGANFEGSRLADAELDRADLTDAHLVGTKFAGANLTSATFTEADVKNASFAGARGLPTAKGLDTIDASESDKNEAAKAVLTFWDKRDWGEIRRFGQLPFLGVSYTILILTPPLVYATHLYNESVKVIEPRLPELTGSAEAAAGVSHLPLISLSPMLVGFIVGMATLAAAGMCQ